MVHKHVESSGSSLIFLFFLFVITLSCFEDILKINLKGNYKLYAIPEQ